MKMKWAKYDTIKKQAYTKNLIVYASNISIIKKPNKKKIDESKPTLPKSVQKTQIYVNFLHIAHQHCLQ